MIKCKTKKRIANISIEGEAIETIAEYSAITASMYNWLTNTHLMSGKEARAKLRQAIDVGIALSKMPEDVR